MTNYPFAGYALIFFETAVVLNSETAYFCATIKEDGSV